MELLQTPWGFPIDRSRHMKATRFWQAILFVPLLANCSANCGAMANENVEVLYTSADRTASYEFLEKVAKYHYIYPAARLAGQKFPLDNSDLIPNAIVRDCSDLAFRCLAMGTHVLAIPRTHLSPVGSYTAAGNRITVVKCMRGDGTTCQVALLKSECFYSLVAHGCTPARDEDIPNQSVWRAYFIYNEDFGVTSFGIESVGSTTLIDMLNDAKDYILVGSNGLLKP